jgi:beta-glucosidase
MNGKKIGLLLIAFLLLGAAQPQDVPGYKNTNLAFEERARDLERRMTLEEKISQLGHTADAIGRLEIPEYNWWNEGLHGVARAGVATVFPQTIGMAATFDDALLGRDAEAISTEFRAKYNASRGQDGSSAWYKGLTVWSPNINIFRDPRWGRGQETYGEDPYLTSRMGVAFVKGLQGDDPRYLKTVATPKHFAVHSGPESTRHEVDVKISRHDLEGTYLPAFRATVMEAGAQSVMCAYNSVNGQPACANQFLLGDQLRDAWKFKGYVVSDCGAIEDISAHHQYRPLQEQGVAAALAAGTDLICGVPPQNRVLVERTAALNAVRQGILPESIVDLAVTRTLIARFKLGMFDPPDMLPWVGLGAGANDTPAHRELALQTARESLVLLKNDNRLLPLKKHYPNIAVIGPDADSLDALEGNYNGTPSAPVTILAGLRKRFSHSTIRYVQGSGLVGAAVRPVPVLRRVDGSLNFAWGFSENDAVRAARDADLVVMVLGLSARIEGEEMKVEAEGFSGGDRTAIDLPGPQEHLLESVNAVGKPVVLVLTNGSALAVTWANQHVPAIIEAWYPGEAGGTAVAEALAGDFSPAGRLPVTFYKNLEQVPAFEDYSMASRTYRYFAGEPLYRFGYGLSYTRFEYGEPKVSSESISADESVTISANVANRGGIAGDEVVQLYLTHEGLAGAPVRELRGFKRIHLAPGQRKTVSFTLRDRDLSAVDAEGTRHIASGPVQVWIGGGQPSKDQPSKGQPSNDTKKVAGVSTGFKITSSKALPD